MGSFVPGDASFFSLGVLRKRMGQSQSKTITKQVFFPSRIAESQKSVVSEQTKPFVRRRLIYHLGVLGNSPLAPTPQKLDHLALLGFGYHTCDICFGVNGCRFAVVRNRAGSRGRAFQCCPVEALVRCRCPRREILSNWKSITTTVVLEAG